MSTTITTVADEPLETGQVQLQSSSIRKAAGAIHSSTSMSLLARKVWNVLLGNALKEYPLDHAEEYEICLKQLALEVGFNSKNVAFLKKRLVELVTTPVEWNIMGDVPEWNKQLDTKDNRSWGVSSALASAVIIGSTCKYSFSLHLKKLLLSPELYGIIPTEWQRSINSVYSLILLENCSRFRNEGQTPVFDLPLLKRLLGAPDYEWKDLNRKILQPAVLEIGNVTTVQIDPRMVKSGRSVTGVQFLIKGGDDYPHDEGAGNTVAAVIPNDEDEEDLDIVTHQQEQDDFIEKIQQQMKEMKISVADIEKIIKSEPNLIRLAYAVKIVRDKVADGSIKSPRAYLVKVIADQNFQAPEPEITLAPSHTSEQKSGNDAIVSDNELDYLYSKIDFWLASQNKKITKTFGPSTTSGQKKSYSSLQREAATWLKTRIDFSSTAIVGFMGRLSAKYADINTQDPVIFAYERKFS